MKLVINACYGGFSLSPKAIKEIIEGESEIVRRVSFSDYAGGNSSADEWTDLGGGYFLEPGFESNVLKDGTVYFCDTFEERTRSDPVLVNVVERLGEDASGKFSSLKVVEIPDGVDFYISDYDGNESVHEQHRRWD